MTDSLAALNKKTKLITIQGQARGGKGVLVRRLVEVLSPDNRVKVIEQGLKFRIFAKIALDKKLNYENLSLVKEFVANKDNQAEVLALLKAAETKTKEELDGIYYIHEVSNVSGMFGKVDETHDVVVGLLLDEARAAASEYDVIIVDGRAMMKYGDQLDAEGVVDHVLAVDVICEPLTAARRVTGIFAPVEELSNEQLIQLITTTQDISRRNSSDARRKRDPSVFLHEAFEFDVLHPPTDEEHFTRICEKAYEVGVLSLDNSFTRSIEQFTEPSVKLIVSILERSRQ